MVTRICHPSAKFTVCDPVIPAEQLLAEEVELMRRSTGSQTVQSGEKSVCLRFILVFSDAVKIYYNMISHGRICSIIAYLYTDMKDFEPYLFPLITFFSFACLATCLLLVLPSLGLSIDHLSL